MLSPRFSLRSVVRLIAAAASLASLLSLPVRGAQSFLLPTANRALFEPGGEERYFVGTVNKPWTSGTFGCVRTDGWQLHEGIDIRCLERDRHGEPTDPVLAAADGSVAYLNKRPGLSNYGNYLILRHVIEGMEIFSLYAHLKEIRPNLKPGDAVKAGEPIAIMGRTSNTREGISRDRAHVHFEVDLMFNEKFPDWYAKTFPTQRNDHGLWNGRNLVGLDPRLIFHQQRSAGASFSLVDYLRRQTELCRVLVRERNLSWARRFPMLVKTNPVATREGIAGYELVLNFNGLPYELIPRAASEFPNKSRYHLLRVNVEEKQKHPCRKLVLQKGNRWQLANNGQHLLNLLVH